jgi:hypothetical protein
MTETGRGWRAATRVSICAQQVAFADPGHYFFDPRLLHGEVKHAVIPEDERHHAGNTAGTGTGKVYLPLELRR